jgi:hypothetical protein
METKPLNRRHALGYLLGQTLALATATAGARPALARTGTRKGDAPRVLTAWNVGEQSWAGVWAPGQAQRGVALPARAHHLLPVPPSAQFPGAQALVMARRPGEFLLRMDTNQNRALQWHRMELDRYLGGHAALAPSGNRFFTTETDGEDGHGLVVERDLHSLQALREFPSGGIGPHALLVEADGTLLVANGGILNLPETGRRKLNLDHMDPNLSRIDPRSGKLLAARRHAQPAPPRRGTRRQHWNCDAGGTRQRRRPPQRPGFGLAAGRRPARSRLGQRRTHPSAMGWLRRRHLFCRRAFPSQRPARGLACRLDSNGTDGHTTGI